VTDCGREELEGITFNVYLYVARKGKPVGPRDVMKGMGLSSPSVAYRHLQKLEDWGYVAKDLYGGYTIHRKASIKGRFWLGRGWFLKCGCMPQFSLLFWLLSL